MIYWEGCTLLHTVLNISVKVRIINIQILLRLGAAFPSYQFAGNLRTKLLELLHKKVLLLRMSYYQHITYNKPKYYLIYMK